MIDFQHLNIPVKIASFSDLAQKEPTHAQVLGTDLVIIRYGEEASVLYGRCHHRGALLADGFIDGKNLICGVHNWDYRYDTGVSAYAPDERLKKFNHSIKDGGLYIDQAEIEEFEDKEVPPRFNEDEYLGKYQDTHPEAPEPYNAYIQSLAKNGLKEFGHHGQTTAMGVERDLLPNWNDIQFLPAQLSRKPLLDEDDIDTSVIIGPKAKKPLKLDIPLFVSDMSFGALSREAKIALSKGAEMAGTGICSGEGGMLEDEQKENSKYLYELASAKFGFSWDKMKKVQAFHFKGGQGAKTGTGGHLPGHKVVGEIAEVRGLSEGTSAISPATFTDIKTAKEFAAFADTVREESGGVPIGFKIAASRIEEDIDFALDSGVDYIILDGRGGGTGAAPIVLRNHINVPTIPALARARKHLDKVGAEGISLVITGGLRVPSDFAKAMAMGADAIAVSNSALQAIGCLGMRACHTDNCPVGIATQKQNLRSRLIIEKSAERLANYFTASANLMKVISRAVGHDSLSKLSMEDLSTFDRDMHHLTGIQYAGVKS
ncbi:glutamate synthase-related protein [Ekhidna sp.]|uniref:glutamate synthase-related protein n=1 Tax=Ekhidna sp. TaxID=2608089 RepID=UPI003BA89FB5